MIKRNKASIYKSILHKVGNKFNTTKNAFSENTLDLDEESYDLLLPYLLRPFTNLTESYRFHHHSNTDLNEINTYASRLLENTDDFIEISKHIVTHLFEQSNSSQIKTGDVLICYFNDLHYEDYQCDAVGIFKIESRTKFFQTYFEDGSYDIIAQKGIANNKVDKGCIILNAADTEGRIVLSVDNNSYDAQYWIKNFLNLKFPDDSNQHTKNYFEMCKEFSDEIIKPQFGLKEQNSFLAKTVDFFKENEVVNVENFKEDVLAEESNIQLFEEYKKTFESDHNIVLRNQFDVAEKVIKKEKKKIKTDIKLDTNIQIKLDIDAPDASSEYLERGFDSERKMYYYKVYFNEENTK